MVKKSTYGNESISSLKGPDRVRKRPGVIFGSDGIEGCTHSFFEILSNSTDEAKAGFGNLIETFRYKDGSITVKDHGRGVPLDWNKKEGRYNWDLIYCELYAGGKYDNDGSYTDNLGLNGLGATATQYSSEFFDVTSIRDGYKYTVHFKKGNIVGEMKKEKTVSTDTGTTQHWKPDSDVFTDINIPLISFQDILKKQAIVNAGIKYTLFDEESNQTFEYIYPEGILGYVKEVDNNEGLTTPVLFKGEGTGRDRDDRPEYTCKAEVAFCFNNKRNLVEYYHNSSWLEHGGSPDKALRSAIVSAFDKEYQDRNMYQKNEGKVTFDDIADSLIFVSNSFSQVTSYENQTKKAINNKFIQQFMTNLIKDNFTIWFTENKIDSDKVLAQVLVNKRSRETSEQQRITIKKKLTGTIDVTNKVKKFVDCRKKDPKKRELFICLRGNTKIKLFNSSSEEIEKLVGRTDLTGYSTDRQGNFFPAKIKKIFKTQDVTETIKIVFMDNSFVECTPEHRFLDKASLEWYEAKKLIIGQNIATAIPPLYSSFADTKKFYLKIKNIIYHKYTNPIPVYCLNIDSDFHSFVLDNGIITHNCEGDSALGSVKQGRDADFQAIMPIRGKILNCAKADLATIFKSDIITDLIRVFGCGVQVKDKHMSKDMIAFDINKLRFNKIIIMSDQDVDGFHIRCLVITMIYRLCPELIKQGYVYIGETPLYEITYKEKGNKTKTYFAYSDGEKDKIIKGKDMNRIKIQRSKGLGENTPEMMWETSMNPEHRRLIRVNAIEAEEMEKSIDLFMGNNIGPRKTYIEENGHLYLDDLDLS